jgi:hypothetical protein
MYVHVLVYTGSLCMYIYWYIQVLYVCTCTGIYRFQTLLPRTQAQINFYKVFFLLEIKWKKEVYIGIMLHQYHASLNTNCF